jgi:hypothetical protein
MKTRTRRILGGLGALTAGALIALFMNLGRVVDRAMTPGAAFDPSRAPPPPDYRDDAQWSALPARDDLADRNPRGVPGVDPRTARADVFYVHPTTSIAAVWNASTTDAALNAATDRVATGIQAAAFNECCAVYAPRYRQANGTAFYRPTRDGDRAIDLAYDDVRRAFGEFLARRGSARPFIVAAHSQGSVLAERLLTDVIAPSPLRERLVVAYLLGGRVTVDGLRTRAPNLAPCRTPDELHCVAAWNARSPSYVPGMQELTLRDTGERVCTNPLTWRDDGAPAPADANLGAVFLESDDPAPRPGFADARCDHGILRVTRIGHAPRDFMSRILDHVIGAGNHHPIEFQMFFMNLRANAIARVAAHGRGDEASPRTRLSLRARH